MSTNRIHYFIRNIFQNSKPNRYNFEKNKKLYKKNIEKNRSNYNIMTKRIFSTSSSGFPSPNNNNRGNYILIIMMAISSYIYSKKFIE